jgi:methylmalonyl-CoA mutase
LNRGAESLRFTIGDEILDIVKLLEKLPLENVAVLFQLKFFSIDFVKKIDALAKQKTKFFYNLVFIGQLAKDGNWF